jgi:hypothetical protein
MMRGPTTGPVTYEGDRQLLRLRVHALVRLEEELTERPTDLTLWRGLETRARALAVQAAGVARSIERERH